MKDIFFELIQEACTGNVIIEGETWPIAFNTIIEGEKKYFKNDDFQVLEINNLEIFFSLLEEYLQLELKMNRKTPNFYQEKEKNRQKWIIAYLFVNATTEDFKNPILYLKRRISFLKDHTFSFLKNGIEIEVGKSFQGSKLKIQREEASISMETPFKINFSLQKEINNRVVEYSLPSIYYAIDKDTCYIYSIMNPKEKKEKSEEEKKYQKKMNRILYKLNNNLSLLEMKEYYDYKEGKEEYYPEGNISDITHSFCTFIKHFYIFIASTRNS